MMTLKYGMRFSTIKYWQEQANALWHCAAIIGGSHVFNLTTWRYAPAKDIAKAAIQIAMCQSPDKVRSILRG